MKLIEYADREMLAMQVANDLAGALREALDLNDTASLAVPGGTSPGPIFDLLSAADLAWDRVHVLLTDERWVPESDSRSNAKLLKERLFVGPAAQAHFIPFYVDGAAPGAGSAQRAPSIAPLMPLSVLLLGMGADMHTASLFPGAPGLDDALKADAPVLCPVTPADQPTARVSLSAPALDGALSKHLVIYGDEKRRALETALSLPPQEAPIGAVLRGLTVHWSAS